MNAYAQAQSAYAPATAPTRTARSAEYEVIARISHRLKKAIKNDDFPALAEALYENNKLWTALAVDVADDDNLLPDELRARIIYLAEFTRLHTHKVLRKQDTAIPLLEINALILGGLKPAGETK
ncbi:flagellar biosynthesis regulator FlaF [Roseobacter sinensis]|uniref:Flagellar biosynthesis regulator FlaF n=1 Tax=Roseobacter sinensis TaxID=2931391 RepID=A0ABT3B8J7_9RHOB|nr:flagellar biosynthesis regulator FlaF [Roseobacter sp. WL0113]MCV3269899.1 flagellar biosynthesis regulator FlaF [Roseobacter sp. WL0113]